jgi:flagellar protein FlbD
MKNLTTPNPPGGGVRVIQLTRLNNAPLAVNSDLIKYVEAAPDTVITLANGEKLVVRETPEEVIERVREFRRSIQTEPPPGRRYGDRPQVLCPRSTAGGSLKAEGPERG